MPSHPQAPSAYHQQISGKGLGAFAGDDEDGEDDYDEDNAR